MVPWQTSEARSTPDLCGARWADPCPRLRQQHQQHADSEIGVVSDGRHQGANRLSVFARQAVGPGARAELHFRAAPHLSWRCQHPAAVGGGEGGSQLRSHRGVAVIGQLQGESPKSRAALATSVDLGRIRPRIDGQRIPGRFKAARVLAQGLTGRSTSFPQQGRRDAVAVTPQPALAGFLPALAEAGHEGFEVRQGRSRSIDHWPAGAGAAQAASSSNFFKPPQRS